MLDTRIFTANNTAHNTITVCTMLCFALTASPGCNAVNEIVERVSWGTFGEGSISDSMSVRLLKGNQNNSTDQYLSRRSASFLVYQLEKLYIKNWLNISTLSEFSFIHLSPHVWRHTITMLCSENVGMPMPTRGQERGTCTRDSASREDMMTCTCSEDEVYDKEDSTTIGYQTV